MEYPAIQISEEEMAALIHAARKYFGKSNKVTPGSLIKLALKEVARLQRENEMFPKKTLTVPQPSQIREFEWDHESYSAGDDPFMSAAVLKVE